MYPQTVVPSGDELHTTLTNGMDVENSGVIATGTYYTANKDDIAWSSSNQEKNPVYEYQGKHYVRVTPYQYAVDESTTYRYNYSTEENPDYIGRVSTNDETPIYRWFKVEPIKWIIINYNYLPEGTITEYKGEHDYLTYSNGLPANTLELYAADALVGGIRFGSNSIWNESTITNYLNEVFLKEAFPMTYISESTIYNNNGDGTNNNVAEYGLNANHLSDDLTGQTPTNQKIYLLSRYELSNSSSPYVENGIFTTKSSRQLRGTDYARAHYLILYANGFTRYWTRTAADSTTVWRVTSEGDFNSNNNSTVTLAVNGTRPALTMVRFLFVRFF